MPSIQRQILFYHIKRNYEMIIYSKPSVWNKKLSKEKELAVELSTRSKD